MRSLPKLLFFAFLAKARQSNTSAFEEQTVVRILKNAVG
jgi:hypothetical protein